MEISQGKHRLKSEFDKKEGKNAVKKSKRAWTKEPEKEFPRLNSTAVEFTMELFLQ